MSACRRTAGILDAWLQTGQLGPRDERHLAGCRRCTEALVRVDDFDSEIRAAVRSLVFEAASVGVGPASEARHPPRSATPRLRFGAGLASLAAVVVLVIVAGIRIASTTPAVPAASAEALLPVPVGPADDALHQSGLRCTEIDAGLECTRRLADGWQQVALLEVAGGDVRGLEVRLEPGTGVFPVDDVAAALSEPATDVLGVDLTAAVDDAVDASGIACACTRRIAGGAIRVEGDPVTGYLVVIEAPDDAYHTGAVSPRTHSAHSHAWSQTDFGDVGRIGG